VPSRFDLAKACTDHVDPNFSYQIFGARFESIQGLEKPGDSPRSILEPGRLLHVEHVFCHFAIEEGIADVQLVRCEGLAPP